MIYDQSHQNESHYVSVNTLIRPKLKKHSEFSASPAIEEQKEQAPSAGSPLATMPIHESFSNPAISKPDDPAKLEADRVSEEITSQSKYQPGTNEGKKLLAHELSHVVQPRENGSLTIQRQTNKNEYTITSTQGNIIKVGAAVTYIFNGNIPEGADFTWVIENDPNTYEAFLKDNPGLLQRFTGNTNQREMQAVAKIPGTHIIRVDITKGGQYITSAEYKQIVLPESASEEDILIRTLNYEPLIKANRLQPGTTKVTPEVAFNILENMSKNEPPFKPELGKGGCSWFITEGSPYTSVEPVKSIDIPVELKRTSKPVIFDEGKLAEIYNRLITDPQFKAEIELKYRQFKRVPADQVLKPSQITKLILV